MKNFKHYSTKAMTMVSKLSRDFVYRYGGLGIGDSEPWYDESTITVYKGDTCPDCGEGKMKVSQNNKLYCSKVCWLESEQR